jgi:hypothetical protein
VTRGPPETASLPPLLLLGCGILRKEVEALVRKNGWRVEARFLDSALHNYLDRLSAELDTGLAAASAEGRRAVAVYGGGCHPLMDRILARHGAQRTRGQNCLAMLLGYERFMAELSRGAYFLLEEWALGWEPMITACFGTNLAVTREIFQASHRTLIALRTPCSGDFRAAAEAAARLVDLPLEWSDVGVEHLEAALADAVARAEGGTPP